MRGENALLAHLLVGYRTLELVVLRVGACDLLREQQGDDEQQAL